MVDMIEANWLAFAAVLVLALVAAWWLFGRAATPRQRSYRPDVLDEGVGPAQRNQALIDAPPAAFVPPPLSSDALGGMGEVVAMAAQAEVQAAQQPREPEVPQPSEPLPAPETPVQPDPAPELPDESPQESPPPPQIAPEPVPTQAPAAAQGGDDLSRIKGLGPKLQALLPTLGLTTYAQIAALDDAALAELDGKLGAFAGRPAKDNWVAQARHLAAGDLAGFEAQFGKL